MFVYVVVGWMCVFVCFVFVCLCSRVGLCAYVCVVAVVVVHCVGFFFVCCLFVVVGLVGKNI